MADKTKEMPIIGDDNRRRVYQDAMGQPDVTVSLGNNLRTQQYQKIENDLKETSSLSSKAMEEDLSDSGAQKSSMELKLSGKQGYFINQDNFQQPLPAKIYNVNLNGKSIGNNYQSSQDDENEAIAEVASIAGISKIEINNLSEQNSESISNSSGDNLENEQIIEVNDVSLSNDDEEESLAESLAYLVPSELLSEIIEVINAGSSRYIDLPKSVDIFSQNTLVDNIITPNIQVAQQSTLVSANNQITSSPSVGATAPLFTAMIAPPPPLLTSLKPLVIKPPVKSSVPSKIKLADSKLKGLQELKNSIDSQATDINKLLKNVENTYSQISTNKSIAIKGRGAEFIKNAREIYSQKLIELNNDYIAKTDKLTAGEKNTNAVILSEIQSSLAQIEDLQSSFKSYNQNPVVIKALENYELVQDAQVIIEMQKELQLETANSNKNSKQIKEISEDRTKFVAAIKISQAKQNGKIEFNGKIFNNKTAAGALKTYSMKLSECIKEIAESKYYADKKAKDIKNLADKYSGNNKIQEYYLEIQTLINADLTKNLVDTKVYLTNQEKSKLEPFEKKISLDAVNYKSPYEQVQQISNSPVKTGNASQLTSPPPAPVPPPAPPLMPKAKGINVIKQANNSNNNFSAYKNDPKILELKPKYLDKIEGLRKDLKLHADEVKPYIGSSGYTFTESGLNSMKLNYLIKNAAKALNIDPLTTENEIISKFNDLKIANESLYTQISNSFHKQLFGELFTIKNKLNGFIKSFNKISDLHNNATAEFQLEKSKLELFELTNSASDIGQTMAMINQLDIILKQVESNNKKNVEIGIKDGKTIFSDLSATSLGQTIESLSQLNKVIETSFIKRLKEVEDTASKVKNLIEDIEKSKPASPEKLNELATVRKLLDSKLAYHDLLLNDAEEALISTTEKRMEKVALFLKQGDQEKAEIEDIKGTINILRAEYQVQANIEQKGELNKIVLSYVDFSSPEITKIFKELDDTIHNEEITDVKNTIENIANSIESDLKSLKLSKTNFDKSIVKNIADLTSNNATKLPKIISKSDFEYAVKKRNELVSQIQVKAQELYKKLELIKNLAPQFNDQALKLGALQLFDNFKNKIDAIDAKVSQETLQAEVSKYKDSYSTLSKHLISIATKAKQDFEAAKVIKEKAIADGSVITLQIDENYNNSAEIAKKWASLAGTKDPTTLTTAKKFVIQSSANVSKNSGGNLIDALKGSPKALAQKAEAEAEELKEGIYDIKSELSYEDALADLLGFTDQLIHDYSPIDLVTTVGDLAIYGADIVKMKA